MYKKIIKPFPKAVRTYRPTPDVATASTSCARKPAFSAVASTNGRDRLMCSGSGAPRSLVRNEWKSRGGGSSVVVRSVSCAS